MDKILEEAAKYTPTVVEDITGIPAEKLIEVASVYATNTPGALVWAMGLTQHTIGSSNTRIGPILQLLLGNMGVEGGGCNILRGHDNVQGATDMCCLSHTLPGYYGLSKGAWEYFAKQWDVSYEYLVSNFKSEEWMQKKGFTLSRWYAGVLGNETGSNGEDKIYNAGTNIKALIVFGNGITSISQQAKIKEALDNLELLVLVDPFSNEAAILTDKTSDVFLLPAATQFESSGSVTATNRTAQWREKIIDPLYESKTDDWIMFELAKRLGFYDELTKGMSLGKSTTSFTFPEDATDEIARSLNTIGLNGWTSQRLKRHNEFWHKFDPHTLEGRDEVAGENYGLPWPCWTTDHPGSPILYNINKSVAQGGMGFRNRFGLEHEGVDLLAQSGSAPIGSSINDGYPEITADNIESLGITLTQAERDAIAGTNWKTDTTGIIIKKAIEAGLAPYGNAKARAVVWTFTDQIPKHREALHTTRYDLRVDNATFANKEDHFRVDTQYESIQNVDYSANFPTILTTGRLVTMNGAGLENRVSKYLAELIPEMFVNIHPNLASSIDVKNNDMVWIQSPEGTQIKVKAKLSFSVDEQTVFLPFHYAGKFQGADLSDRYPEGTKPYAIGESANTVTNYGYDIVTQIPETKAGLCKIVKA